MESEGGTSYFCTVGEGGIGHSLGRRASSAHLQMGLGLFQQRHPPHAPPSAVVCMTAAS